MADTKLPIPMPVSDVAEWDDDERLKRYGDLSWPMSGRDEAEVMKAAEKLKPSASEE